MSCLWNIENKEVVLDFEGLDVKQVCLEEKMRKWGCKKKKDDYN